MALVETKISLTRLTENRQKSHDYQLNKTYKNRQKVMTISVGHVAGGQYYSGPGYGLPIL